MPRQKPSAISKIGVTALGCRFSVWTDDDASATDLDLVFADESRARAATKHCELSVHRQRRRRYKVAVGARWQVLALGPTWPRVDDLITLLVVRERRDLAFVHGSSIQRGDGAALLVGSSTCGKTTLAAALGQQGLGSLADDVTPLNLECGTALPFRTRPTLRPFTQALVREGGAKERSPSEGLEVPRGGVPVRWVFFLEPGVSENARTANVEKALEEWDKMYELCIGEKPPKNPHRTTMLVQRDERDFMCEPDLRECPESKAVRLLMNHMHRPHPRLKEMLPALARFFEEVNLFTLKPGYLDKTIDLILDAMQE